MIGELWRSPLGWACHATIVLVVVWVVWKVARKLFGPPAS